MENKFSVNQIVKGKVCGFFVVLGYRVLNDRRFVQVKPYNPKTGETSRGEIAFEESALETIEESGFYPRAGYNSFYGEVVTVKQNGEVTACGFVIDNLARSNEIKVKNVMAGF